MQKNDMSYASVSSEQLKKYARDLAELYASEKEKMKTLTVAKQQLEKYADAFASIYEPSEKARNGIAHCLNIHPFPCGKKICPV